MTVDPFAPVNDTASNSGDPFADPSRGSFPKVGELLHKLLVMTPVKVEQVPDKNNPGKMQDRWSIDTTVIHEDGSFDTYDSMYWSQKSIAEAARKAQKEGRPLLGTLHVFPVMASKSRFANEAELLADEDIQRWISRGVGNPPTQVAWALEPANSEERTKAIKWWNENVNPFGK